MMPTTLRLLVIVLLTSCAPAVPTPSPVVAPTATRVTTPTTAPATPTPTIAPPKVQATPTTPATAPPTPTTPAKSASAAKPSARKEAQIVRVVDGDTLRLRVDGKEEAVRMIGLNTPESVDPRRPVECLGKEASAQLGELLRGVTAVQVEPDPTQDTRDRFGRLLLYVWLPSGTLLNKEMIRLGYAHEYTYDQPYRFQADFKAAQKEAEVAKRGLWAPGTCEATSTPTPRSPPNPLKDPAKPAATVAPAPAKPSGNCHPAYPTVCIPPPPPDLDCRDIPHRRFRVLPPDPHRLDGRDQDGIGCES